MNAPEIYHEGKGKAECGAYQSMSELENILKNSGQEIRLERLGKDKYDRTLALVFLGDGNKSVNEYMVRK